MQRNLRLRRRPPVLIALVIATSVLVAVPLVPLLPAPPTRAAFVDPSLTTTFVDINPDESGRIAGQGDIANCKAPCPGGGSGGRVNGVATVRDDPLTSYAASEVGGLFKTINGGDFWFSVDDHLPTRMWDVAVSPNGSSVYASSFYDGRVVGMTQSGIQVSANGGFAWSRASITPPASCSQARTDQPSAFGISIRPGRAHEVLVGTNCGVQRTVNSGNTWTAAAGDGAGKVVWDVVALPGRRAYACGEDGLMASPDGFRWTVLGAHPAPGKSYCVLAVSPDDPNVVFAVFANPNFDPYLTAGGGEFFEGLVTFDATGQATSVSWSLIPFGLPPQVGNPPMDPVPGLISDGKRNPILVTNDRSTGFDLWVGAGNLHRIQCDPAAIPSCPTRANAGDIAKWSDTFTDANGDQNRAHGDAGDLEFDPATAVDACPTFFSSDGGIYRNKNSTSPRCHEDVRQFLPANAGVHAQLVQGMAGVQRPGTKNEAIYVGLQDNALFATGRGGIPAVAKVSDFGGSVSLAQPGWTHGVGGDINDVVADAKRVATTDPGALRIWNAVSLTKMNVVTFPGAPPGNNLGFCYAGGLNEIIDYVGPNRYVIALFPDVNNCPLNAGVLLADNLGGELRTSDLGTWPRSRPGPCHVQVSTGPAGAEIFVQAGRCNQKGPDELWRFVPSEPLTTNQNVVAGTWTPLPVPAPGTGFSMFGVDPVNPDRLYAAVVGGGRPRMVRSDTGGDSWERDDELSDLMHGRGEFVGEILDAGDGVNANGQAEIQPHMVAFDPGNPDIIVAGGRESGVFLSSDGGESWALLTDPSNSSVVPHLPRPLFAHFEHDVPGTTRVYLGTVGRGVWRIDLMNADLEIGKSDTPDPVQAGSELTYTIGINNAGPGVAHRVELEDTLPAGTTFKSVQAPPGWSCTPPAAPDEPLRCKTLGMTPEAGCCLFTIAVDVDPAAPSGTLLTNTARVVSASVDPVASDNTFTTTTTVTNPGGGTGGGGGGFPGPLSQQAGDATGPAGPSDQGKSKGRRGRPRPGR